MSTYVSCLGRLLYVYNLHHVVHWYTRYTTISSVFQWLPQSGIGGTLVHAVHYHFVGFSVVTPKWYWWYTGIGGTLVHAVHAVKILLLQCALCIRYSKCMNNCENLMVLVVHWYWWYTNIVPRPPKLQIGDIRLYCTIILTRIDPIFRSVPVYQCTTNTTLCIRQRKQ